MNGFQKVIIAFFFLMISVACSRQTTTGAKQIMTIVPKPFSNALFYTGTIRPLKTRVITSPQDGVIVDMPLQSGELVHRGQLLFMLSSVKFLADYKAALMQYIKAKSEFNTSQSQLSEAKFLHQHQLISDDDYKTKQSNYYGSRLALLQAKDVLENLILQLDIKETNLYKLTIADIDKITKALHLQANSENIRVVSPATGVVLSPSKSEEENKKIAKGDAVKQGDVLALVGDLSGISVQIKINELTVNQIKVGQRVKVTGIAFPDEILAGQITRVDRQGETANASLPTFSAEVIVPRLSPKQRQEIHVGMSAKVEIDIDEAHQITVPIAALSEKQGISYLQRYDEKNKHLQNVAVKTGKTTAEFVAILSGIKYGDKIVIPH